jgi:hypothetical protein
MPLGVPELFLLVPLLLLIVVPFVVAVMVYRATTRRARRFGYASTLAHTSTRRSRSGWRRTGSSHAAGS